MATFDPFANQGGAAAWDPDFDDDSRAIADDLLGNFDDDSWPDDDTDDTDTTEDEDDDFDDDVFGSADSDDDDEPIREFDDEYPEPFTR